MQKSPNANTLTIRSVDRAPAADLDGILVLLCAVRSSELLAVIVHLEFKCYSSENCLIIQKQISKRFDASNIQEIHYP